MNEAIQAAIAALTQYGHVVRPYVREDSPWFEIDDMMLASWHEMEELGRYILISGVRKPAPRFPN
jgi:hypothetical protein